MRPLRTLATTALAATLVAGLSACGDDEPTEASSSDLPSTSAGNDDQAAVEGVFDTYWQALQAQNPSTKPSAELKAVMTADSYADSADFAASFPAVTVEGKDELTASRAEVTSNTTATVEYCYEVHQQYLTKKKLTRGDQTAEAGTDIRSDHNGRPIKDGTEMVNLVSLTRSDPTAEWKVDTNQVGYRRSCDLQGESS
ncbi:hypothetical protein ON003_04660 [Janibacter hoylei]|uniref:hypothetical protein n=1 Tax=Janibacter hoylei TaxID=364298 RepID=UPI002238AF13|nr:hypothetical protein [Janibacter hoylei]MCW4600968.1 hypothetical protein [Janibacter hoylei]